MWVVITKLPFEEWFEVQPNYLQDEILAVLCVLRENGPLLGRPYVDTLSGSKFMNMKELEYKLKVNLLEYVSHLIILGKQLSYVQVIRKVEMKNSFTIIL